jgi:hypothetical protein
MAVCQNLVPLVNIKIAGKWMFIPLKMVLIGIDPYPNRFTNAGLSIYHCRVCLPKGKQGHKPLGTFITRMQQQESSLLITECDQKNNGHQWIQKLLENYVFFFMNNQFYNMEN